MKKKKYKIDEDGNQVELTREEREELAFDEGWDEDEMSLEEFEEYFDIYGEAPEVKHHLSRLEREELASDEGWDEDEMSLEEFEDYFG